MPTYPRRASDDRIFPRVPLRALRRTSRGSPSARTVADSPLAKARALRLCVIYANRRLHSSSRPRFLVASRAVRQLRHFRESETPPILETSIPRRISRGSSVCRRFTSFSRIGDSADPRDIDSSSHLARFVSYVIFANRRLHPSSRPQFIVDRPRISDLVTASCISLSAILRLSVERAPLLFRLSRAR